MRATWMLWVFAGCAPQADDPIAPSPLASVYTLPDEVGFPEGFAFDGAERAFLLGSLEHGGITRVDADGATSRLYMPDEDGWMSLGMKLHPDTSELLVCAVRYPNTPTATSALWIIDAQGDQRAIALTGQPTNCNDVAPHGDHVFLTDREAGRVHRVTLSTNTAEVWLTDAQLDPGIIGNNGIVLTEDDVLIIGQYTPPRLLRVPLAAPDQIAAITLSGDAIGSLPNGADGIAWFGEDLIIAANQNVARLTSTDGWLTATVVTTAAPQPIAAVTVAEGRLFGLKGEVVPFVLGTPVSLPFQIVEVVNF